MECELIKNKKKCNCTYTPCSRKGKCCECITYHLSNKELPACCFTNETERRYDRSFEKFAEINSKNKN